MEKGIAHINLSDKSQYLNKPQLKYYPIHHYKIQVPVLALHTIADSSCSTGFSETITLPHRAAKAHIHKELSVFRERCTTTQYLPYAAPQKIAHL